jgi:hypothetical protein
MIYFGGGSFNTSYLRALRVAVSHASDVEHSRAGPVINLGQAFFEVRPHDPRLIFLNGRRLNGAFAIVEGAWVLSGSNLLEPLLAELPNYRDYSDDELTLSGAYGYRLSTFFGLDQVSAAIDALRSDNESRRVVLTMYSPLDIQAKSKDIPCNTTVYLKVRKKLLDITVLNRSNDLYLGVPYNVFVFGLLQRFVADALGLRVGAQRHFSDSLHLYTRNLSDAQRVVDNNFEDAVEAVSGQFDWEYSQAIIANVAKICSRSFASIESEELKMFLTNYCAAGRTVSTDAELGRVPGLLGFVGYQFSSGSTRKSPSVFNWDQLRERLMMKTVRKQLEALSTRPGDEIAAAINELTLASTGAYEKIRAKVDERGGPFALRTTVDEDFALRGLLLCAVYSLIDPWIAGSEIGSGYKENVTKAAQLLGVAPGLVYPITSILEDVFQALEDVIPAV